MVQVGPTILEHELISHGASERDECGRGHLCVMAVVRDFESMGSMQCLVEMMMTSLVCLIYDLPVIASHPRCWLIFNLTRSELADRVKVVFHCSGTRLVTARFFAITGVNERASQNTTARIFPELKETLGSITD